MSSYSHFSDRRSKCLECGEDFSVNDRKDKKFCCDRCRFQYHNRRRHESERNVYRIINVHSKNHRILETLLDMGVTQLSLDEILAMGFKPEYVTSFKKTRTHHELACYDIVYRLSEEKIFNIRRISLNLRPVVK